MRTLIASVMPMARRKCRAAAGSVKYVLVSLSTVIVISSTSLALCRARLFRSVRLSEWLARQGIRLARTCTWRSTRILSQRVKTQFLPLATSDLWE